MSIYTQQVNNIMEDLSATDQLIILKFVKNFKNKDKLGADEISRQNYKAFKDLQKAFEGEADRLGLKDLDDVVRLVKEVRAEREKENAET